MTAKLTYDDHVLPFRLEWQCDMPAPPWVAIMSGDHREIELPTDDINDLLAYVDGANATLARYSTYVDKGYANVAQSLTTPDHLVEDLHPCDGYPARVNFAFECLVQGHYLHWITPDILMDVRMVGVLTADGKVQSRYIDRWIAWRTAENTALTRRSEARARTYFEKASLTLV